MTKHQTENKKEAEDVNKESKITQSSDSCFIIMPIADQAEYPTGHFKKVYEDIFKPACELAGLNPIRADEVTQTNLIHLDILTKLIDSPMAICDLSSRNPNVLFELGLRQAFDKPTVLVQEIGTPKIFDIAPLRYYEYRKELIYREVIEDQKKISDALLSTKKADDDCEGTSSIVRLLSISKPASLKDAENNDSSALIQLFRSEVFQLRSEIKDLYKRNNDNESSLSVQEAIDNGMFIDVLGHEQNEYNKKFLKELYMIDTRIKNTESRIRYGAMRAEVTANIDILNEHINRLRSNGLSSRMEMEVNRRVKAIERLDSLTQKDCM